MKLINLYDEHGSPDRAALGFLYELVKLRSSEPLVNISHKALPTWDEHVAFVESHPFRAWEIVCDDAGRMIGYVSITARNEIGIVLMPEARGKGIGRAAVQDFLTRHPPLPAVPGERDGRLLANINPKNKRSIALFNDLGFRPIQVTYAHD